MVLLASAHDGIVYPAASQTLAFLPCDPVLGASLNDTFDGDGAAELGATIDNGGDTMCFSRPIQASAGARRRRWSCRSARWGRGSRRGAR